MTDKNTSFMMFVKQLYCQGFNILTQYNTSILTDEELSEFNDFVKRKEESENYN